MTGKELVGAIATRTDFYKKDVAEMMEAMADIITESMIDGDKVAINGLFTMYPVDVPGRMVRNPSNEERVWRDAHKRIRVKVSKTLYKIINPEEKDEEF